jgi:hypothetical protein
MTITSPDPKTWQAGPLPRASIFLGYIYIFEAHASFEILVK